MVCLLLVSLQMAEAQQLPMEENLERIEKQLDYLADSLVPGLNEMANFSVAGAPVQELLRGVAETHRLNISVDPNIHAQITNNFTQVQVKNLLLFLVKEYRLDVVFINSILSFRPYQEQVVQKPYVPKQLSIVYSEDTDKLSLDLHQDSLSVFARQLTQAANKNVIVAPNVPERLLNGYISSMPFEQALSKIAYTNNLELEKSKDGFFILKSGNSPEGQPGYNQAQGMGGRQAGGNYQSNNTPNLLITPLFGQYDTLISVDAVNVPVKDVIREASLALGKDYIFFSEPPGNTISQVHNISYDELLRYLLHGSTHTFQKQANVYLVGDRAQEGFRATRLIRFQFRTIEEIEKIIPVEIAKGVQITPFPELNGIILSGSVARISEIEAFLKAIDMPVPNIMIEVIVMDVRKGHALKTGIQAFLSGDSVVQTQGQVFPGVDATISSRTVNDVLDKLEGTGLVNLGKVRPNFYAKIQALEDNNDIKVRSTPKLSTLNGHEAELSIGQSMYYLEQTNNVTGGVNPIVTSAQQWIKIDANLAIKILPIVSGDEHVTLKISAEFSDFLPPNTDNAPPGNTTRKFISQIRIRNEEMIVLGGLEEARKESTASGFPILSRIPVLKWLFSSKTDVKRDDRLMVFIRPTIVY